MEILIDKNRGPRLFIVNICFLRCPHSSTGEAVDKLVDYFVAKISDPRIGGSVSEMEELLEKGAKLLAHNHYVLTLIRIKVNISII